MTANDSFTEPLESIIKVEPEEFQEIIYDQAEQQTTGEVLQSKANVLPDRPLKSFFNRSTLEALMKSNSSNIKCPVCQKSCTATNIKEHMITHCGAYECKVCWLKFQYYEDLRRHRLRKHYEGEIFKCHCQAVYTSQHLLEQHQLIHKKNVKRCHKCRKRFPTLRLLNRHNKTHLSLPENPSDQPNNKFEPLASALGESKKNIGYRRKASMFCDLCPRSFSQKAALENHMKLHLKLRPLECSICQHSCFSEWHLKMHMLLHSATKKKVTKLHASQKQKKKSRKRK